MMPSTSVSPAIFRAQTADARGNPQFVGESAIGHTPMGSQLGLTTGEGGIITTHDPALAVHLVLGIVAALAPFLDPGELLPGHGAGEEEIFRLLIEPLEHVLLGRVELFDHRRVF